MRSVRLGDAVSEFAHEAAEYLHAEVLAGAEVPFELATQSGGRGSRGPALYCYRPLTGEFIAERQGTLERLPSYPEASELLTAYEGLDRYLIGAGIDPVALRGPARVRAAVRALLRELFTEQNDFELQPQRLAGAIDRLERAAHASAEGVTLLATLHGLTISSPEIALTKGLALAHPRALEGLPEGALAAGAQGPEHLIAMFVSDEEDPLDGVAHGREVLGDLLRALRLFGDGRVTLGALAWARVGEGTWNPVALGSGGRPHGMLLVTVEQEDELRAFCNLVSRRAPDGNELAWALRRYELGCERDRPYEALSDHLLALRALLEPEGAASGLLPGRLAALCATPEDRGRLTERAAQAISLEQAVRSGSAVEHAGGTALANDMADHLRALLRDVICGHLDADLVDLAEEILLEAEPEPFTEPSADGASVEEMLRDAGEAQEILNLSV